MSLEVLIPCEGVTAVGTKDHDEEKGCMEVEEQDEVGRLSKKTPNERGEATREEKEEETQGGEEESARRINVGG